MSNNQSEIIELEFPTSVRLRPGMYLPNISHMVTEIVDNSLDEYTGGYATTIEIYIIDGIITIIDDGRGIPIAPSKKNKSISQAEIAATTLHAGGKFNVVEDEDGNFISQESGIKTTGLHGVGLSVVNALSEWLVIKIKQDERLYGLAFEKGIKVEGLSELENLEDDGTGTEISFVPDMEIWNEEDIIDIQSISKRLKTLSYLNPGLRLCFYVKEKDEVIFEEIYESEDGLVALVEKKTSAKKKLIEAIDISGEIDDVEINVAFVYTDSYNQEDLVSFCNNASTLDHGDHVTGFKTALAKSITDYINKNKMNVKYDLSDLMEGLTAVVSVKVQDPYFDGQGKSKIKMKKVRQAVKKCVEEYLDEYLEHNPDIAKVLLDKYKSASSARIAAQSARDTIRKIKETSGNLTGLAGKLASCTSKKPEECEIYIVEGDSAGGSAKQARNRYFQAILPIFGKILNVEKKRLNQIVDSEKLRDFIRTLGCGVGEEFDISKLKYHKIIIMSDADVDGSHIKILWLTFIYKYMRELITSGYVYFSCPPLYKISYGNNKTVVYVKDDEEKDEYIKNNPNKKLDIQRFKGLGEMNPNELWKTTMDPDTRTLEQICLNDIEEDEYILSVCMGEEVVPRKEFIMNHSLEAEIDN